jgi:hypothetical protein
MPGQNWIELLANLEFTRRNYRANAESSSRLSNVVKAAEYMTRVEDIKRELAEVRAQAVAEGIPAHALTAEIVEAWAIEHLDGGPYRVWDWDVGQDLPASMQVRR